MPDFALFEHAPDPTVVVDDLGRIVFANHHVFKLLGFHPDALIGCSVEELIPSRYHGDHRHHRVAYGAQPTTRPMAADRTLLARTADGGEVAVEVSLSPMQSGHTRHVVAAIRDATERVRHQREAMLLNEVAVIAATTDSFEEMMWAAVRAICRVAPFRDGGWVAVDSDGAGLDHALRWLRNAGDAGDRGPPEATPLKPGHAIGTPCTLATRVLRSGHAEWIDDLGAQVECLSCAADATAMGLRMALVVPVADANDQYAVLMLARGDAQRRDDDLIALIARAIGQITSTFAPRRAALKTLDAARLASTVFEYSAEPKLLLNAQLIVELANPAFHLCFGTVPDGVVGWHFLEMQDAAWDLSDVRAALALPTAGTDRTGLTVTREFPVVGARHLLVEVRQIRREDEIGRWTLLSISDRTEAVRIQERIEMASRLESIGRLAGGVAHDFNNLLVPILSSAEIMLATVPASNPLYQHIERIRKAADRAAGLTRQLLAYGRKQSLELQSTDVRAMLDDARSLISSTIGEAIAMTITIAAGIRHALIDRGQLSQCLLNLAANAHDAMPDGGRLVIDVSNVTVRDPSDDPESIQPLSPGDYVVIVLRDTGTGMDSVTKARLFEPFFSTKGTRGTGLGLSTVYGAVAQMRGNIAVSSVVGGGTIFRLYLPATTEPAVRDAIAVEPGLAALGGSESILLVEDDEGVRAVAERTLMDGGYTTLVASTASDAIELSRRHRGYIDLLLTDVVMPGMTGYELAARLRETRPALLVICMSGYTDHAVKHRGAPVAGTHFVTKPFTPSKLLTVVRGVLDLRAAT